MIRKPKPADTGHSSSQRPHAMLCYALCVIATPRKGKKEYSTVQKLPLRYFRHGGCEEEEN
jgi:hypothetical protein